MFAALHFKEIPVQKPGPDEVLINIKYSGVCHTYVQLQFALDQVNYRLTFIVIYTLYKVIGLSKLRCHSSVDTKVPESL